MYIDITHPEGIISYDDAKRIIEFLAQHKSKSVRIKIDVVAEDRTIEQNAYYHGVLIPHQIEAFRQAWGEEFSEPQMHQWNKTYFFPEYSFIDGDYVASEASTATTSKTRFSIIIERLRKYFRDNLNYEIPLPDKK